MAVVGAGPAGLACAVGLARRGHAVLPHEARAKGGGLNEYGLAAYKVADHFAQRELDWLLGIGGITLKTGWKLDGPAQLQLLPIGRRVVVIGGGMTAVDAAVQSKLLGAEAVHIAYRRGPATMGASRAEQDWALTHGVTIHHWLAPEAVLGGSGAAQGHAVAVRFSRQALVDGRLQATGGHETLDADMVFRAIGQKLDAAPLTGWAGATSPWKP